MELNTLRILCVIVLLLLGDLALGQIQSKSSKIQPKAERTTARSSRVDKVGYVLVEPIGLTLTPVIGIRAGIFLDTDLLAEVSWARGSFGGGIDKASKNLLEIKTKYFIGNSFYVDGGLSYEAWDFKYDDLYYNASSSTVNTVTNSGTLTNAGVHFHIGNQWSWSNFTLGCDWAGFFASLSTSSKWKDLPPADEQEVDAPYLQFQKDRKEYYTNRYGGSSLHITRLYLGWQF